MEDKTLHLIILEDNPDDAELMVKELESEDFTLKWSRVDTEEAFRKDLEKKPDLILADYKLPALDGMSAIKMQQELSPEIPLIIVSGTIGEDIAVECMKAGAVDYILKDSLFRLRTTVKRALEEVEAYRKRRQAERALRESEEQLQTLVDAMPDFVCFKDGDGRWLKANDACIRIFQLEDIDYRGKKDSELAELNSNLRGTFLTCKETDARVWKNGDLIHGEETVPDSDGSVRVFDVTKVPISHPGGERKGLIVLGHDITERKRAEEQLKEYAENLERMVKERTKALDRALYDTEKAREKVDGILKSITDGLIVTDRYDRVVLMNSAVEDLLEVRLSEVIGRPLDFAIRDETLKSRLKTALEKKEAGYHFDVQLQGKDKKHPKIIRSTTSIIKDKEGRYANMVIIMHDVT